MGRSGCFGLNLSDNSVMRGRVHGSRTMKDLVADLRFLSFPPINLFCSRSKFSKK